MIKRFLTTVAQNTAQTFHRFPMSIGASVGLTILLILTIDWQWIGDQDWIGAVLLTLSLAIIAFAAETVYAESKKTKKRSIIQGVIVLLLIFYYHILPQDLDKPGTIWIFRHVFLCLGAFLALTWMPFLNQKSDNLKFWEYNRQWITALFMTVVFAIIVFLGAITSVFATENLFEINIDSDIYFKIWLVTAGIFSPWFFLSRFPKAANIKNQILKADAIQLLAKYILLPIVLTYFIILYLYTGKILISWEWPKNMVCWLVIGFSCVGMLTYALWTPWLTEEREKYRRIFWYLLIPQVIVLFIAIGLRIDQYSWTENRYTVVLFGLWLLGSGIYFIVYKKAQLKYLALALSIGMLLSQFGPWGVYEVSRKAQTERLKTLFEKHNIQDQKNLKKANFKDLPKEDIREISSIVDYLLQRHGTKALAVVLPNAVSQIDHTKLNRWSGAETVLNKVGIRYVSRWDNVGDEHQYFSFYHETRNEPQALNDYKWFANIAPPLEISHLKKQDHAVWFDKDSQALQFYQISKGEHRVPVQPFRENLLGSPEIITQNKRSASTEQMTWHYDDEIIRFKAVFQSAYGEDEKFNHLQGGIFFSWIEN